MKRTMIVGLVILLVVIGGGVLVWQLTQEDPLELAEDFLGQVANEDFADLQEFFDPERHPTDQELSEAFRRLGQAFGLSNIIISDVAPLSKSNLEAVFAFELRYESEDFEPVDVESSLTFRRQNIFDDWKLEWENNLPLPDYGLRADYSRVRLEPSRGTILDTSGGLLAGAGSLVAVGVQPDRIIDPETLLEAFHTELDLNPDYVRSQYEAPGVQGHWFVPVIHISEAEYSRVDPILRPIPGVFFRGVDARAYPENLYLGQLTGYIGEVTAQMIESYPEREYVSGEIVGRAGLEASRDDLLRGRPGHRFYVEPEDDTPVLLREIEVSDGVDIEITIDREMQRLAHEVLGERRGAFVVLDSETGAILVLASTPSYDPNEFVGGISSSRWQELSTDPGRPMFNRALQGLYPPGSVFKVVTVTAALEHGLHEPSTIFVDSGELRVEGNIVRNFQGQVFDEHDLHQAVVDSINTTVAQVGLNVGAPNLEEFFSDLGLDRTYRLGLPMASGQIGTPGRSRVGLAWSAIGQDQVLLTPLHMAQIFSVFSNGGHLPSIHLIKDQEELTADLVLQPETVASMNAMLRDVVLEGTGIRSQVEDLEVYGKTGTAEVVGGGVHGWFAGHTQLPSGEKLSFAVLVEEGGVGGQAAAPLVQEFFTELTQ